MININELINLIKKYNQSINTISGMSNIILNRKIRHYIIMSIKSFLINTNNFNTHDIAVLLLRLNTELSANNTIIDMCDILQEFIKSFNKLKINKFSKEDKYQIQKIIYLTNLIKDYKNENIYSLYMNIILKKHISW